MKKFAYDLDKYIEKNNLKDISYDEALYLFILDISKKNEYRNMINTILYYDKSLEMEDIITDIYLMQLNRKNNNGYVYSTYTFKYDLLRLYKYHTSELRKKFSNRIDLKDANISYSLNTDVEFYDMIKDFSDEDKNILTLYFKENISLEKIIKIVKPINSRTGKPINSRMGILFRINALLDKMRDKIKA